MRFNFIKRERKTVVNHAGAKAYAMIPEMELYAAVATTFLNDTFYESGNKRLQRIAELIAKVDPKFVAKLAVYARNKMNLRSVPVVLAGELAKINNGDSLVSKTVNGVVKRPDEIMEMLAYYQASNNRLGAKKLNKLSKQVQKGLAAAFNRFDEYQFAKYDRDAAIKLRDALFLVHPKAKDEAQQAIFDKIAKKELSTPYTWETELSKLGQADFVDAKARRLAVKAKWEELIDSNKIGYMALLRNLRNILEAGVSSKHVQKVCSYLSDGQAVANSKQLPFRFLAAYRELGNVSSGYTSYMLDAIETAVTKSVVNLKGFDLDTRVVMACDVSGSMQKPVSPKSKVTLYDIGLLLGMLLQSKCNNVVTGMFGDRWKILSLPSKGVLANVNLLYKREGEVGYSTNGYLVIKDLLTRKYVADKIMLFTDTQMWDSNSGNMINQNTLSWQWKEYKKIAPYAKLYVFDLAGYGNTPVAVNPNDVFVISGWSDKIFDMMDALDNGVNALEEINKIEL